MKPGDMVLVRTTIYTQRPPAIGILVTKTVMEQMTWDKNGCDRLIQSVWWQILCDGKILEEPEFYLELMVPTCVF